jgi:hypothetical protein
MADETLFTDILTRLRPGFRIGGEVKEAYTKLKNKLKRNPTLQELRNAGGFSYKGVKNNLGNLKLSEGRVLESTKAGTKAASAAAAKKRKEFSETIGKDLRKDLEKRYEFPKQSREYYKEVRKGNLLTNEQLAKKYNISPFKLERAIAKIKKEQKLKAPLSSRPASEKSRIRNQDLRYSQGTVGIRGTKLNQFHHMIPYAGYEKIKTGDVMILNKYLNSKIGQDNLKLNNIAREIVDLNFDKKEDFDKLDKLNTESEKISKQAKNKLPKNLRGGTGYIKYTPVLDENGVVIRLSGERKGIDSKLSLQKFSNNLSKNIKDFDKVETKKFKDLVLKAAKKAKPVVKAAGKVLKPLGVVTGAMAVNTALKAGERNPLDLAGAYITADPQIATDARRMRQEPEFRKQQIAGLPTIQTEDFTSYFNGGIVAVKGVNKLTGKRYGR